MKKIIYGQDGRKMLFSTYFIIKDGYLYSTRNFNIENKFDDCFYVKKIGSSVNPIICFSEKKNNKWINKNMLIGGYNSFMDFIANNESSIICIRGFSRASMGEFILALNKIKNMDIKPFKHVSDVKKQRLKQENNSEISNSSVLLSKEQIDKIKASNIFEQWLNGLVDENTLSEEEKRIIYAYQVHYDLTLSDSFIYSVLDHLRCYGIDDLLNDENKIEIASTMYNVSKDDIKIQALLTKKRMEKEKTEELEQPLVKKLTRKDNNLN